MAPVSIFTTIGTTGKHTSTELSHSSKTMCCLPFATQFEQARKEINTALSEEKINEIIAWIPEDWLTDAADAFSPTEMRAAYGAYVQAKLKMMDALIKEAEHAR